MMNTIFCAIPVGTRFECNGNAYIKKSSRTAYLIEFDRTFYFSNRERIRIMGQPS